LINKTLYSNLDVTSTEGKIIYDDFLKSFRRLEGKMGSFGNVIAKEYVLLNEYSKQIQYKLIFLAFSLTLISFSLSLYVFKLIQSHVFTSEKVLADISFGEITEQIAVEGKDESAHMLLSLNKVLQNLANVKEFITKVEQGKFDFLIAIFENKGQIYNFLQSMSELIQSNVEEEKKRNLTSEGLAKFVDITRDIQDVNVFYNNILSNLIRYVKVNQGYLYVVKDDNPELPFMENIAIYAYGKQRYLEEKKEIYYKQGLVGQAWFDKEPLYFYRNTNRF
jgi:methyl-accepting chemotaxis protein